MRQEVRPMQYKNNIWDWYTKTCQECNKICKNALYVWPWLGGRGYGFEPNMRMVFDSGGSQSPKKSDIILKQFLTTDIWLHSQYNITDQSPLK